MGNKTSLDRKAAPDLTVLLAICFRAAADELERELAAAGFPGMRPKHGFVFRNLADDWMAPTELARRLGVSKQAVGKIVEEMETDRLLDRRDDAQPRFLREPAAAQPQPPVPASRYPAWSAPPHPPG